MFDLVFFLTWDKHHQVTTNEFGFFEAIVGRNKRHDSENFLTEKLCHLDALASDGINDVDGLIIHKNVPEVEIIVYRMSLSLKAVPVT